MRRHGQQSRGLIEALHTVQEAFGYLDDLSLRYRRDVAASAPQPRLWRRHLLSLLHPQTCGATHLRDLPPGRPATSRALRCCWTPYSGTWACCPARPRRTGKFSFLTAALSRFLWTCSRRGVRPGSRGQGKSSRPAENTCRNGRAMTPDELSEIAETERESQKRSNTG